MVNWALKNLLSVAVLVQWSSCVLSRLFSSVFFPASCSIFVLICSSFQLPAQFLFSFLSSSSQLPAQFLFSSLSSHQLPAQFLFSSPSQLPAQFLFSSLSSSPQLPALFDGCQMYLHGSFTRLPPSKEELAELLRLGGAHLLTREPRLSNLDEYDVTVPYHAQPGSSLVDCGVFIVHDGETKVSNVEAQRMRTVPASWVIECIATFSLVEPLNLRV